MALMRTTTWVLCLGLSAMLAHAAAAQTAPSVSAVKEVVSLMAGQHVETFAAQDSRDAGRFTAALLMPGVQLLIVSAVSPAPEGLKTLLAQKRYGDIYGALHQPASAESQFFLIDLGCDGLNVKGGGADVLFEHGRTQTVFNGDWKSQGVSEAVYKKRVEDTERRYSELLGQLVEALKSSTLDVAPTP